MVEKRAYGRVGLLGNPSDMYGGKCVSFTFDNQAIVRLSDSDRRIIKGDGEGDAEDLEYNGKHNLVKATIKKLGLEDKKLEVWYNSDIPVGSGLSGSSAIIIALMRALNDKYDLGMDEYKIAELALKVEVEELGISAGFQDRYIISFEGLNFMDFSGKEFMKDEDGYGKIEKIDVFDVPFFLCLGVQPKSSAIVHNPLRERFLNGSESERKEIKEKMDEIAELSVKGKGVILKKDWKKLGELMNLNHELREKILPHRKKDKEIIDLAISEGALGAKVAGSGGAVVVLADNPEVMVRMQRHYPCMKPKIV